MKFLEKFNKNKLYLWFLPVIILAAFLVAQFSSLGFIYILILLIFSAAAIFIFKNPFLGLILVTFALPFERIPTYDIGLFTLKINQILAGITLIAWILYRLFGKNNKPIRYPIIVPILFFLFISLLSVIFAIDKSRAISVFVFIVFMFLVSFIAVDLISNEKKISVLINILFTVTIIVCLFGIYQFLGDIAGLPIGLTGLKDIYTKAVLGFPRIQAFSMEPLYFANFLFIPLGVATSLFFSKEIAGQNRAKLILIIILILINIILGISRGAYIALAGFVILFLLFFFKKIITIKNIILVIIISAFLIGSAWLFLNISNPEALNKFIEHAQIQDFSTGESVQKRLTDYQKAVDFWQESPIIGIGLGNYGPKYKGYPSHDSVTDWEIVNNQYLETLSETGILGLVFLSLSFIILIIRSFKAYRYTKNNYLKAIIVGLTIAFIAILIQYNFFSTLYIMHIWVLIGLIIAAQNIALRPKMPESKI